MGVFLTANRILSIDFWSSGKWKKPCKQWLFWVELMAGLEPATSSLPRKCSTSCAIAASANLNVFIVIKNKCFLLVLSLPRTCSTYWAITANEVFRRFLQGFRHPDFMACAFYQGRALPTEPYQHIEFCADFKGNSAYPFFAPIFLTKDVLYLLSHNSISNFRRFLRDFGCPILLPWFCPHRAEKSDYAAKISKQI